MNDQLRQILANKYFQNDAAAYFRANGKPVPENPAAALLTTFRDQDPQGFPALVQGIVSRLPAYTARSQIEAALPPQKVAEAWSALPKHSLLRAKGRDPVIDAEARKRGVEALPGMTPGETLMAYFHAVASNEELSSEKSLASLAAATGNAFGDAPTLQKITRQLAQEHRTDSMADAVGEHQREKERDVEKARGITRSDEQPKPRSGTLAEVEKQWNRQKHDPPTFHVRSKGELEVHRKYDALSGEPSRYEYSDELHETLIKEASDANTMREAAAAMNGEE
jgi:hypothetical protein